MVKVKCFYSVERSTADLGKFPTCCISILLEKRKLLNNEILTIMFKMYKAGEVLPLAITDHHSRRLFAQAYLLAVYSPLKFYS